MCHKRRVFPHRKRYVTDETRYYVYTGISPFWRIARRGTLLNTHRNYAKHSLPPSTEATCSLMCEKNTNGTLASAKQAHEYESSNLHSGYFPHRISMLSLLNVDISFRDSDVRMISKSEYWIAQEGSSRHRL